MKKILFLTAALFSSFFFAQLSKFSGNYSTKSLKEIHKTIPQDQKHAFYKQYSRALFFEEMKETFNYKNYSDAVLKKFTDTVFAAYDGGQIVINENESFKPSETWVEHQAAYKKFMERNPEESARYITERLKFNSEKEKEAYYNDLKNTGIQQKKDLQKTPEELKKEYEELVASEKENFENDPNTSIGFKKMIVELDKNFDNQNSDEFASLLEKNLNSDLGFNWYFPYPYSEAGEGSSYETLPGEILTYASSTGTADGRSFYSYRIIGDNLVPLNIDPTDDNFYKKVSKYAKKGWRFEPRAGYSIEKNKSGEYLISTSIYAEDDTACCPSFSFEYKTKDFKNFTPSRIAKNEDENLVWKEIK